MSKRRNTVTYAQAIKWIALHDDTEWLFDAPEERLLSVTATMVAHLFDRTDKELMADLEKALDEEFLGRQWRSPRTPNNR